MIVPVQGYELMQQQIPTAVQWLQIRAEEFVEANNLTSVIFSFPSLSSKQPPFMHQSKSSLKASIYHLSPIHLAIIKN